MAARFVLLLLVAFAAACGNPANTGSTVAKAGNVQPADSVVHDSLTPAPQAADTVKPGNTETSEAAESGKKLVGKIIRDLEDATLLRLVYGSCDITGDHATYNWGPQIWSEGDSVIMQVAERLGDENTRLIYIRGERAITAVMHNHFNETVLLLNKTNNGWRVADAVVDEEVIDFSEVELAATQNNRMLLRYSIAGTYAGGVMFASDSYSLLSPASLTGPSVSFITGSSNTASSQCFGEDNGNDCNCYDRTGETKFSYDQSLQCFVFSYNFSNTLYDCDVKNGKTTTAKQTWYMNADTVFMGNGNEISEWGETIGRFTSISQAEIRKLLQRKK